VRKEKKWSRHVGQARVLTYKHDNEGLKKLAEAEAKTLERQQALEEKKRLKEERKTARETLDRQWKADLQRYHEVVMPAWQAECTEIDAAWAAAKQATGRKRGSKKPPYPLRIGGERG